MESQMGRIKSERTFERKKEAVRNERIKRVGRTNRMSNRAKSPARSNEYSNSGNEEQQKKKKPLARDYVHAFLLRFNVPLFSFLACAALPFMPKHSSLTWFQCVYVYGWSLLPAL